jgi:hypothetical protein
MAVTINGTSGITFNDATTQSTSALNVIAAATAGAVGTYVVGFQTFDNPAIGSTTAGSNIRGWRSQDGIYNPSLSGTWRHMGLQLNGANATGAGPTLWLRIS